MSEQRLKTLKRRLARLWLISPERLWLLSIAFDRRGLWLAAFATKQLNTVLYRNSLSPAARVAPDIVLGHYSQGVVINGNVEIGRGVKIWHNVTLTAGRQQRDGARRTGPPARIVIEDGVNIGTNAVIIAPRGLLLRIGRGARIGASTVVTGDVPAGATVVSAPARVILREHADASGSGAEIGSAQERNRDLERGD